MIRSKKQSMIIVGAFVIALMLFTTTYAFFNYTRTGSANVIKTGRISFNHTQGNSINLTNMFPIDVSNGIPNDATKVGTLTINVTGDTTYTDGIEYLVTAVDVSNTVGSGNNAKSLPISISVAASNLGTEDEEYFDHVDNANSHMYRVLAKDVIEDNGRIAVGYIKSGATGVNGSITIKAYLDKAKVVISDTYPAEETDTNSDGYIDGTPTSFGEGKTVFTTAEWNQLQTNGVSFKIKVEAREGLWVEEIKTVNVMNTFPTAITSSGSDVKEIYFNKMGATRMQNAYDDATIKADLTNNDGTVLAWLEENPDDNTMYNLIVASDGDTYLPANCQSLFYTFSNVEKIEFNNANTSNVTNMTYMFGGISKLKEIDLSSFDTSNVTAMEVMFMMCSSLQKVNMNSLGGNNLTSINDIFYNCTSLKEISMDNFNFGQTTFGTPHSSSSVFNSLSNLEKVSLKNANFGSNTGLYALFMNDNNLKYVDLTNIELGSVQSFSGMFTNCSSLETVIFDGVDTSGITSMSNMFNGCSSLVTLDLSSFDTSSFSSGQDTYGASSMFDGCSSLTTIYVSDLWDISNQPSDMAVFYGCTSLVGTSPNGTTYAFTDYNTTDKTYAVIATDSTPGYLTDASLKPTN